MKRIDLMTLYQPHQCLERETEFVEICHVEAVEEWRLTRTDGTVNFTDLWLSMVNKSEKMKGKYVTQHFSLLSDCKEDELEIFFKDNEGNMAAICLMKYRTDISLDKVEDLKEQLENKEKCRAFLL